jgi:DUF1009 family protein
VKKLGLIAGGGALPLNIALQCQAVGRPLFVVRLKGIADPYMTPFDGADIGLAELGKTIKALKNAGCEAVCLAGIVKRPDWGALKPDLRGLKALTGAVAAARGGDDALLSFLVKEFESDGFTVEGAHEIAAGLTLPAGPLSALSPTLEQMRDVYKAFAVAGEIGRMDIGQGAVVCEGLVLAVEAQEGTDAMLVRCAGLPLELRGSPQARRGAIAKRPKPMQEQRVDLPAIGIQTIENAAQAGLAGVVGEAGKVLVLDRAEVIAAADRLGVFVYGLTRDEAADDPAPFGDI